MKKNYIYNLIRTIVNILFPILSFPYASRVLGPTGIGKFQFVTSFAQYFVLIANLGIPLYGTREIAKHKGDREQQSMVFSELVSIAFFMSVALTLVYLAVTLGLNYFHADCNLYITAALSVFLGFTTIDWLYTGLEEFRMIAIRSVAVKLLSLILLYVFVKNAQDVITYLGIAIFSSIANNAYNIITLRSTVSFKWHGLNMAKHLRPLLLIFGMSVATSMYTLLDVVLLGFLSSPMSVGLYSAAAKLSRIVIPFIISIGTVTMPKMSHFFATRNTKEVQLLLEKSLHFILFFSIPAFAGLALLAPELITLFSGKEFIGGALSMQILALLPLLIGLGYFWSLQILLPAGKDKEIMYSVLAGMIISIILNFVLVPRLKDVGEAIANVTTEFAVTMLYVFFVRKHYSFSFDWSTAFKAMAASVLFIPIVILLRHLNLNLVVMVIASGVACCSMYFSIQWLLFKDHLINTAYQTILSKLNLKQ